MLKKIIAMQTSLAKNTTFYEQLKLLLSGGEPAVDKKYVVDLAQGKIVLGLAELWDVHSKIAKKHFSTTEGIKGGMFLFSYNKRKRELELVFYDLSQSLLQREPVNNKVADLIKPLLERLLAEGGLEQITVYHDYNLAYKLKRFD